ncbi:MAG TPA: glycosyltransferase [Candidatus Acidoferrales bacterium]|jgi:glycosyltransferase involved in cell wall biosynthesis|nr:glycosyltransferase [Candidatus Acidoferrales bacterium]
MNPHLSIVIPAYNEAAILPVTLDCLHTFLTQQSFTAEVIVVDDGSRDRTPSLIGEWQASFERIRLLRNPVNLGKGASIQRGVLASRGEYVFVTDADLPGRPEDILRLLRALREGAAIAIASRPPAPMRCAPSRSRFVASLVYRAMVRAILNLPLRDTQCGFKAFVRKPVVPVFEALQLGGFSFDVEFLYAAWKRDLVIREIDFEVVERRATRHAILLHSPRMMLDLLRIRFASGRGPIQGLPESVELKLSANPSEQHYLTQDYNLPRQK